MKLWAMWLALALSAAGCISRSGGIATPRTDLKVGETEFADVIRAWGNPDSIKRDEAIWVVDEQLGGQVKAAYMMIGVTASRINAAKREYRLRFDDRGVLLSWRVADSLPGGPSWSLLPW